ncbi:MAG: hypothetical protein LBI05_06350, partial [Planctomycetaceae bacterium]|nr:hypothetical protein [Planctomycetaceae bacterium]
MDCVFRQTLYNGSVLPALRRCGIVMIMSIIQVIKNEVNDWVYGFGTYGSERLAYLGNFALFSYQTFL